MRVGGGDSLRPCLADICLCRRAAPLLHVAPTYSRRPIPHSSHMDNSASTCVTSRLDVRFFSSRI